MSEDTNPQMMLDAAAWLTRLNEGSLDLEDELELMLWLDEDPAHRDALRRVAAAWQQSGAAADLPDLIAVRADALGALRDGSPRRKRFESVNKRPWLAAAAACVFAVLIASMVFLLNPASETYSTAVGERRQIVLEDGSQLSLDAASKVEVHYTRDRRALQLLSGRASFKVAKDPRRPFTVVAGDHMVVATGTAFSVELLRAETRVVLYEGSVTVLEDDQPEQPPRRILLGGADRTPADLALKPGSMLVVPNRPSAAGKVQPTDAAQARLWEQGQLVFSNEPLATAAERVNRYLAKPIVISDPEIADLPVSGTFNAGDAESFIEGISALYSLRARPSDSGTVVERAPN